ncbi:flagellin [Alphaproteobacteria bacterium]|nr:flagellin [Alphaproteobacteria bacterium]
MSQTVSSLDLSGAEYGTLLLKDKLHDQALAYSVVTVQQQHLSSLNTHIQNVQYVVDQLAVTDPSETEAHTALVEELADREDQLSRFIGTLFHSNEFNMSAIINPDLGGDSQNETINIYDSEAPNASIIGEIAAIEVNFSKIFETLHNESTCPHCIALAQQTDNADPAGTEQPAHALDANDNSSGAVADIDGKATTDTANANLEPLRMSSQWDVTGDATLTYSFYDGDVAYASPYNGSNPTPGNPSSVASHGATNEATLSAAFDAWDATVDFEFAEVEEDAGEVGEFRVAFTDQSSGAAAFAYAPGNYAVNGDIWFETEDIDITGNDFSTDGIGSGGFNYFAALHEIGHAVGLSHPFDAGDDQSNGDDALPLSKDSMRNTVMTYVQLDKNFVMQFDGGGSSAPSYRIYASTPMMYDVEIMEQFYGADDDDTTTNNTYSFAASPETLQTIVDAGGTDTIDASLQTRENVIDLNAGAFSSIGIYSEADQVSDWASTLGVSTAAVQSYVDSLDASASAANSYYSAYSRTALYTGEYNVGIAHNAVIENATGGSANDTITGNASDNVIDGGAGDDLIEGNGGDDTIDGGAGTEDVAVFNDAYANYTITESGGTYTVAHNGGAGADGTDTITNVEFLEFTDQTIDLSTWPTVTTTTTPANSGAQGASGSGSPYSSSSSSSSSSGTLASADVSTQAGATAAIAITDSVLETISEQLATLGALQNRLTASISNLSSQSVMTEAAIGRVLNADFSTEMAELTKSMVLSQAANHVLAGAQLSKSNLVKLLK